MLQEVDSGLASVSAALELCALEHVLVVISDNGGVLYPNGKRGLAASMAHSNHPLRGGKGTGWEGGVRTLAVIRGGGINEGGGVYRDLFHVVDWGPTLLSAAGIEADEMRRDSNIDGRDHHAALVAVGKQLHQPMPVREEIIITAHKCDRKSLSVAGMPNATKELVCGVIRIGDLKLILSHPGDRNTRGTWHPRDDGAAKASLQAIEPAARKSVQCGRRQDGGDPNTQCTLRPCLFNISADPCETADISRVQPWDVERLYSRLQF